MTIVLKKENVSLNKSFATYEEAIRYSGEKMVALGLVKEEYINSMLLRQEKLSVYIGNFVALPHGESDDELILNEGLYITQVPDGVDFSKDEQRQVATIIMSVALKKETQLSFLQELAFFCADIQNVRKLSDEMSIEEFVNYFNHSMTL